MYQFARRLQPGLEHIAVRLDDGRGVAAAAAAAPPEDAAARAFIARFGAPPTFITEQWGVLYVGPIMGTTRR